MIGDDGGCESRQKWSGSTSNLILSKYAQPYGGNIDPLQFGIITLLFFSSRLHIYFREG